MFNVSSTSCNNKRHLFMKLSYSAIDNVLINLLPAGLQDCFQVPSMSKVTTTVNKLLESSPHRIVHQVLTLGYSVSNVLELILYRHLLTDAFSWCKWFISTTSAMTSHRILITRIFKCTFLFPVFLFVYVIKALLYANFRKLGWKSK